MSMFNKYKSLVSGQAVKDMKLVLNKAQTDHKLINEKIAPKLKNEIAGFYADKNNLLNNGASKRKMKKVLNGRLDNIKNYSNMQNDSLNNLNNVKRDLSKMRTKQNVARVGTVGAIGGLGYGGKKLYDNNSERTTFEIIEEAFEKIT